MDKKSFITLGPGSNVLKLFYVHNLRMFVISQSVCPWKAFTACVLIVGKAGTYLSEALSRCSTLEQAPGLTHNHQTRLERLARNKQSHLLRKFVNCGQKSFLYVPEGMCRNKVYQQEKMFTLIFLPNSLILCQGQHSGRALDY